MRKPRVDYLFLFSVLALSAVGLIMIFSASPTMAMKLGDSYYYLKRHIFYLLLGFSALYYGTHLDLGKLKRWAGVIFALSIVLLFLIYIPGVGKEITGASRWINLGIVTLQPSELLKFTTILIIAGILSKKKEMIEDFWHGLLPPLILVGAVSALVIIQPDLGTAVAIALTAFIMLFCAGARILHLGLLAGLGVVGITAVSITSAYRFRRLAAFIDPWKDPQGIGFHIIQSLLAVGSGGIFGSGLGGSRQKFFYLPQQFTDFIFAILCEELGFIGGVGVVALFILLAARGIRIAYSTSDSFSALLAAGLVSWLTLQALINIMVVVGLIPTTGIPLPFISFGGTATIINLFSAGILLNISLNPRKQS